MKKENMLIFWNFSWTSSHFTYSPSIPFSVARHPSTPRPHLRGPSFTDPPEAQPFPMTQSWQCTLIPTHQNFSKRCCWCCYIPILSLLVPLRLPGRTMAAGEGGGDNPLETTWFLGSWHSPSQKPPHVCSWAVVCRVYTLYRPNWASSTDHRGKSTSYACLFTNVPG